MEEPPAPQGDPPNTLPLQCVLKEDECSNLHWQDVTDKIGTSQNSRLLFLTVEYIEDVGNNQVEFNNYSPGISENDRVSPLDPNLSSSGRYSPLYNTLVIPTDGQSSFQNSVVVVPTTRNNSQISIFVDQSQVSRQLIVSGQNDFQTQQDAIIENLKLEGNENSQLIVDPQSGFMTELNPERSSSVLGQKVIITTAPSFVETASSTVDSVGPNGDLLGTPHTFFQGEGEKLVSSNEFVSSSTVASNDYSSPSSPGSTLLSGGENVENKPLLDPSEYVIHSSDLKQDELLLSASEQNNDLLMKTDSLMEVDSYNLADETYIASEDGNSYSTMDEQLSMNNIEKPDNEYLLPDTMPFEDADSSMLHTNLEAFASQVLDNNGLFLYDKTKLRQNSKKHPAEHLGFDYWCEDCDESFGIKCNRHEVKVISDKPILSRARATLPKEHLAINKLPGESSSEGVFARKTIPKRVQFGPIEGILLKEGEISKEIDSDGVELLLEVETGQILKLDVSDEHESNWMRFVRRAKTLKEQNLVLTQQGRSLYFTTTRVIPPRHELKVGYSPQYAEKRKLTVLEDLSWNCFECPMKFSTSEELQKHLNVHESEKGYDDDSNKKKSKAVAQKGMPNILRCKGNSRNRNVNDKVSTTKENECWSCHKVFPRTYSLKRHMMLVHADKDKENSGVLLKNVEDKNEKMSMTNTLFKKKQSSGSGSEWLCTHCNLTFDNPSVLNLHTLTHAAEDLESEAVSGLPSELSSVYHEGEFLIENGDVQCPQCTQEFPSKRELIDHVSTHGKMTLKKICPNPSKPYKCDQCYKSFASDIRLQRHMLVHGSEETKPYQCDTCFKRFLNNSALSCHLKTHYDKKCFECPLCKDVFEQVFGLKEHVKIHSSDGLFTCPHCNKVFDGYSVVRKHIRAFHSGHQHICKDCGKMCPTLDKLRMHSLRHSDHREFLCANCGKQFKRKDKLKEHMKRMHSVEREMKLMSSALRIPNTKDRRFTPKMSPMAYDRFIYKCRNCMVGFKRRGMLVNHLAKRHPDIVPDTVPELNLPILKTTRDYFCQYCDKIYKSSSKRKAHILKNHPGAELPMSNRQKGGIPYIPGVPNPTFSQTVGSVKTTPHGCQWCHKQYASKAKLLQHQRKKHQNLLPQAQQIPRPARNASSPVGSEIIDSPPTPPRPGKVKIVREHDKVREDATKLNNQNGIQNIQNVYELNNETAQEIENGTIVDVTNYKKTLKGLPENISCDLLHQAMTELSQTFSEYKLPFPGTQENLLKMIGIKDGIEGTTKDEGIPAAQMTRTWPELPPYPPR